MAWWVTYRVGRYNGSIRIFGHTKEQIEEFLRRWWMDCGPDMPTPIVIVAMRPIPRLTL